MKMLYGHLGKRFLWYRGMERFIS